MAFSVTIDKFEGPLDLMLYLVKENELDLFDLDLSILTDQYLAYITQMEDLHLEIESEYLVELASLVEFKSKRILPKDDSELNAEYEESPEERFARRMIEYQKYKEVSETLNSLHEERLMQHTKPMSIEVESWVSVNEDMENFNGNPYDLVKAMIKCLRRAELARPIETKSVKKELSVEDRILQIQVRLRTLPKTFTFDDLLQDSFDKHTSIVTFLAVLELAKKQLLLFTIKKDEVWFTRG